jgi:hypothetical protein
LVKLLQSEKALLPIVITELGIVTLVKLLQLKKAPSPIVATEFPIAVTAFKPSKAHLTPVNKMIKI